MQEHILYSFRLLTELYSFLFYVKFSSTKTIFTFPSPYGVIFILIDTRVKGMLIHWERVSVSLRSYIHSYTEMVDGDDNKHIQFPSPYGVIFILIEDLEFINGGTLVSFRLLTELYSFLFHRHVAIRMWYIICFRLLTELYSFL